MNAENISSTNTNDSSTSSAGQSFLVNLGLGLGSSLLVALVCGIAWGLIAYFTDTIYAWIAIFIGFIIPVTALSFFRRANILVKILLVVPCLALVLSSVALGDFLYYTLNAIKELGMSPLVAVREVANAFVEIESSDGLPSLAMGGIGAVIGFFMAAR